jgi:hypothetical protein
MLSVAGDGAKTDAVITENPNAPELGGRQRIRLLAPCYSLRNSTFSASMV